MNREPKTLKGYMEELNPTPTKKEIVEIVWGGTNHTELIFRISLSNIYLVDCNELITWIEEHGEASRNLLRITEQVY